ncbi:hypothetical protein TeGR_g3470 [Tetraparma gracilis]|uniref:F-box protein n=1 Tax=Tetraparma gracilis TaxID=2962635 RepID=A0ABQ6N1B5_9STRA|nr:hypothetical protein TeGR_g3470 [Tetraparma gracilis]
MMAPPRDCAFVVFQFLSQLDVFALSLLCKEPEPDVFLPDVRGGWWLACDSRAYLLAQTELNASFGRRLSGAWTRGLIGSFDPLIVSSVSLGNCVLPLQNPLERKLQPAELTFEPTVRKVSPPRKKQRVGADKIEVAHLSDLRTFMKLDKIELLEGTLLPGGTMDLVFPKLVRANLHLAPGLNG